MRALNFNVFSFSSLLRCCCCRFFSYLSTIFNIWRHFSCSLRMGMEYIQFRQTPTFQPPNFFILFFFVRRPFEEFNHISDAFKYLNLIMAQLTAVIISDGDGKMTSNLILILPCGVHSELMHEFFTNAQQKVGEIFSHRYIRLRGKNENHSDFWMILKLSIYVSTIDFCSPQTTANERHHCLLNECD